MKLFFVFVLLGGFVTVSSPSLTHGLTNEQYQELKKVEEIALSESAAWPSTCTTSCSSWSYSSGYSYGQSIAHWSTSSFEAAYEYYMYTCGCFNYATGLLEGYGAGQGPQGNPSNNDGNTTCTQWDPRRKRYVQVPC